MEKVYDSDKGVTGLGRDIIEAENDLKNNLVVADINTDKTGYWRRKKAEHGTWSPVPGVLHLNKVGAIIHHNEMFINTVSGKIAEKGFDRLAHYSNIYYLIGDKITHVEFSVYYKYILDTYLKSINPNYGSLEDFPEIDKGDIKSYKSFYYLDNGVALCQNDDNTKLGVLYDGLVLETIVPYDVDIDSIIAYLLSRLNILYNGKNMERIVRE